ncbi:MULTISPECIES: DNA polymerase [unclassified Beijerinckia]|uniref:DNA polymerase n=1 Tax=unclassified Beijerinckia TaxID=2638183 RepID=UPI00089B2641|nr:MULTISPECIES: DNA polymerase [unclassified Beijerinckia]MDH7796469.1 DNA polymerase I-like protein with 3'-5' exonuclease and polymerase domains [Beijerinckia sp. GAS462]SEC46480.1 DNA polymerase family A [Beijerinckia sp. 28-YEA-48]
MTVPAVLVDKRNIAQVKPQLVKLISEADFIGHDFETHDDRRHEGLNQRCGYDPVTRKKAAGKKLIFDMRRTDLVGASFYSENMSEAYYMNFGHADVENRLEPQHLLDCYEARKTGAYWVAHNAPFELAVAKSCLGYDLENVICTLQMAVSTYSPDEYNIDAWRMSGIGEIQKLVPLILRASLTGYNRETREMTPELSELAYKIIAKESSSAWSWNGLAGSLAYGYGLKQAVQSHFGHRMTTFAEVLGDKAHMGELTGEEVVAYGADDSYWTVRLFRHLLAMMMQRGGNKLVETFMTQENPMTKIFADAKLGGLRVNSDAIKNQLHTERQTAAGILRTLRAGVKQLLPFPAEPNANLLKFEKWYQNNHAKYRQQIVNWANLGDQKDDYAELMQARGSISNQWTKELGAAKSVGPNYSHYMPIRTLLYDLIGTKPIVSQGKIEGDGEARGKLLIRLSKQEGQEAAITVIEQINALASVDQRAKLYIAPYLQLTDPETNRMYPTLTSMLATRRMAGSEPNPMQLAKRGESVFVRGYFLPDEEDHVIVSIDWSGIELVEIGEFSGDREFIKAFGQLPHEDLHGGSAADILRVELPFMSLDVFKKLRAHDAWGDYADDIGVKLEDLKRIQNNLKGEVLEPKKAYGYWRTEIGKGANFNYWYSGWLATIGERMGWDTTKTADATDAYRARFPEAEAWRVGLIEEVQSRGYITLPDGQRYTRYESTNQWFDEWCRKFITDTHLTDLANFHEVMRWIGRKIAKRGGNQSVNAYIQGTCATIAKRSILSIEDKLIVPKWRKDARFLAPIHDEVLFSVHREIAPQFITQARDVMITHPDLFQKCKLDASPSVGLTFAPWTKDKARLGQVELFEPDAEIVGEARAGKRLDEAGYKEVIDWLFEERAKPHAYAQAA